MMQCVVILCIASYFALYGCSHGGSSKPIDIDESGVDSKAVISVNLDAIAKRHTVNLSDIVDSYEIIQLEDVPDAYFKAGKITISNNYIVILPSSGSPAKLFKRTGKFISNLGAIGRGPGEYTLSAHSAAIDESEERIYLAGLSGKFIHVYNLDGSFIEDIETGGNIQKPTITTMGDSALALVHLAFADRGDKFVAAKIPSRVQSDVHRSYYNVPYLAVNLDDDNPNKAGFSNELWGRATDGTLSFQLLGGDTLYTYTPDINHIAASLVAEASPTLKRGGYTRLSKLPNGYLIELLSKSAYHSWCVDNDGDNGYELTTVYNDYLGNVEMVPSFVDGYWIQRYTEPEDLADKLKEHLAKANVNDNDRFEIERLISQASSGNAIIFLGRLSPEFPKIITPKTSK